MSQDPTTGTDKSGQSPQSRDDRSPADLTAHEAVAAIRSGNLTSESLVTACLDRIKTLEPAIKAWAYLDPQLALAKAREADQRLKDGKEVGPLNGIPVGIKDIISTADFPTVCGSPLFANHRPKTDAACVAALKAAGAVIMGKTVTTELASLTPSATRNPRNTEHTPGGSSSGSAAAVSSRMVPLALGTQTAGSVIRPASFCGIYGLKPTTGLISRRGVLLQSHTLDTIGVHANDLEDLALIADVIAQPDQADPACLPGSRPQLGNAKSLAAALAGAAPRFAFVRTPAWDRTDQHTRAALAELVSVLNGRVVEVEIPELERSIELQRIVQFAENSAYYGPFVEKEPGKVSDGLKARLSEGAAISAPDYIRAVNERDSLYRSVERVLREHSVVMTPAAPGPAPRGLGTTGDPIFNGLWTFLGVPALTLPLLEADGLPIGVQLVAARRNEAGLFATARWLIDEIARLGNA
jgi:Asp-tRNA(Asn)/Glu-tRNA(Gln) amidotransferase A subunit family amidase